MSAIGLTDFRKGKQQDSDRFQTKCQDILQHELDRMLPTSKFTLIYLPRG
jgi:hypothetical protein